MAAAQDLDDLMSEGTKKDAKDKRGPKSEESEDSKENDSYSEPDPWERPPADAEPAPKPKEVAAPETLNPPDDRRLQIGLLIGYGFEIEKPGTAFQDAHPFGLGFGLQVGYTLDFGLYLGATTSYYLGSSTDQLGFEGETINAWSFGAEVGFDVWIADTLLFRPSVQIGALLTMTPDFTVEGGRNLWAAYVGPGAAVLYPFADFMYVGADLRLPIAFEDGNSTLVLALTGGVRFD